MNCFKFDDKKSYLQAVKSLSNKNIELERLSISNLLAHIQYEYNTFRSNLFVNYISKACDLVNSNNESLIKVQFKTLLIDCINDATKFTERFKQYKEYNESNNYLPIEPPSTEIALQMIVNDYDRITNSNETGYLDMLKSIANFSIAYSNIVLHKLYNVTLVNTDAICTLEDSFNFYFGGPNDTGKIDYKYSVERFWRSIDSYIDNLEHTYLD